MHPLAKLYGVQEEHWAKFPSEQELWCSLITSPLSPDGPRAHCPKVVEAVGKELSERRRRTVWDESKVAELADVLESDPQMHVADLFPIVGLKGFDGQTELQIWKGRIVLGSHNVLEKAPKEKRSFHRVTPFYNVCCALCYCTR